MINLIVQTLLVIILILQAIVLIHIIYTRHKTYVRERNFWNEVYEKEKQFYDNLKCTVDRITEAEEKCKSEQREKDENL